MKKFIAPVLVSTLSLGTAMANDLELVKGDFTLGAEGDINLNYLDSDNADEATQNVNDSHVTLTAAWKNKVRAVIRTKIADLFESNDIELKDTDDWDLDSFLEEAFIEIRDIGGKPVAVILGKRPIAFGQNVEAMPIYTQSPMRDINEVREVMGITVELSDGLLGLVDSVEFSLFEDASNAGDMEMGDLNGKSVRIKKTLAQDIMNAKIQMELSHAELGDEDDSESRTSFGLIAKMNDGSITGWFEGTILSDSPEYPDAEHAITAGIKAAVTDKVDVVVEYSHLLDHMREVGIGAMVKLTEGLSAGAEIRYKEDLVTDEDDVVFGLMMRYSFGNATKRNQSYYFGDE